MDQVVALLVVAFTAGAAKMFLAPVKDVIFLLRLMKSTGAGQGICEPLLQAYGFEPVFYDDPHGTENVWVSVYFHTEGMLSWIVCDRHPRRRRNICVKNGITAFELVPNRHDIDKKLILFENQLFGIKSGNDQVSSP